MLSVQPCLAQDFSAAGSTERRVGGFAGVSMRLPMGGRNPEWPSARLQLTATQSFRHNGMQVRSSFAPGVELGAGRRGGPAFFMGGSELDTAEQRNRIGGTTTTVLVIGAVVLMVLVLAAVASAVPTPGPSEGAFD
jgi:hypothetical protein